MQIKNSHAPGDNLIPFSFNRLGHRVLTPAMRVRVTQTEFAQMVKFGKHVGFRFQCRKAYEFESRSEYYCYDSIFTYYS